MVIDPVVAEVRAARERIADASGGDMHAIATAARQRQIESGVTTVTRPSRQPIFSTGSRNNAMHPRHLSQEVKGSEDFC
jgi:hypothetical protein